MSSIRHRIVLLVLKAMGIKKSFSQDPVNYHKIRKGDKAKAPNRFYRQFNIEENKISDSSITQISSKNNAGKKKFVLFIHGGAFISGPAIHHWDAIHSIVKKTDTTIWLVNYPKAPEFNIQQINDNIDQVYQKATEEISAENIILIGDSVGGTLILSLTQRLIQKKRALPERLILITPVLDASMTNSDIEAIEKKDPMLGKTGIVSAKKMAAQNLDLKDASISPLYGNFKGFPRTDIMIGGKDIMAPDGLLVVDKMKKANVDVQLNYEAEMPHIYPLLPIMLESKKALSDIIKIIKQ